MLPMSVIVGQLRISRMSKREIAAMNLFFGIRHHKHIVNDLKANYGITEEDNTLFGEFGEDGEYIIPSISRYLQLLDVSPHLYDAITTQDMDIHESDAEKSLRSCFAKDPDKISTYYSSPAGQCPQLYLNFHIYNHHSDPDYSYLIWNGIEKNNYDLKRAICYIECILERMGYTIEAGVMCIDHLNGDYTLTEVKEHGFVFTDLHANQFVMDRVCTTYHKFPSIQIRPYVIILKKVHVKLKCSLAMISTIQISMDNGSEKTTTHYFSELLMRVLNAKRLRVSANR